MRSALSSFFGDPQNGDSMEMFDSLKTVGFNHESLLCVKHSSAELGCLSEETSIAMAWSERENF